MYNNEVISPTALRSEGDGKAPGLLQILRLIFRKPALFNSLKLLYGFIFLLHPIFPEDFPRPDSTYFKTSFQLLKNHLVDQT